MGNKFGMRFKESRIDQRSQSRDFDKEEETPEEFLHALLIDNWEETKAAFDALDEERKNRFT